MCRVPRRASVVSGILLEVSILVLRASRPGVLLCHASTITARLADVTVVFESY